MPEPRVPEPPGLCRVLVVDDSVDAADTLAALLRIWGHEVFTAHDGGQALSAARTHRPDVVLLDIGLPDLDGYAVAAQLRAEGLGGRLLVALTGYAADQHGDRVKESGFDGHLLKPIDPAALQRLLSD